MNLEEKRKNLDRFFIDNPRLAIGLSGGVDSAFLLHEGIKRGADVLPLFVMTEFQPEFEINDAKRVVSDILMGAITGTAGTPSDLGKQMQQPPNEIKILNYSVLDFQEITDNGPNRCYFCKRRMFETIKAEAGRLGYSVIADGTNATDDVDDRPGYRAIQELGVKSPLRRAGYTKEEIRMLAEAGGIYVWNKPSFSCLATRIRTGIKITGDGLQRAEASEGILKQMGFRDMRVRIGAPGDGAVIELLPDQIERGLAEREQIARSLEKFFDKIEIKERRRAGS